MSSRYVGGIQNKTPLALNPARGNAANGVFTLSQYQQAVQSNTWPAADPYFAQTVMLLHGNGTNGSQNNTFLDSGPNNFTVTRNGNPTQGTYSPFLPGPTTPQYSNLFDGTSDWLQITKTGGLNGTGDFTVEFWYYPLATTGMVFNSRSGGTSSDGIDISTTLAVTTTNIVFFNAITIPTNTWTHVAIVRSGTTLNRYVNGTLNGSTTASQNFTGTTFMVGGSGHGNIGSLNGYMSNFRQTNSAVYTAAFTPPRSALTAISGTSLLTCQSNRFVDNSDNAFTITRNGDVQISTLNPFQSAGAQWANYFDGTGDYLSLATNAAFDLGSGDFTIEAWVFFISFGGSLANTIISKGAVGSVGGDFYSLQTTSAGVIQFFFGSGSALLSGATLLTNTWIHLAVTRSGTTFTLWVNGVSSNTATSSTTLSAGGPVIVGSQSFDPGASTRSLYGYISNARIIKGGALYASNFTPPTAPLIPISGTSLLTCQSNRFVDNSSNNFTITRFGDTRVTPFSPFPVTSAYSPAVNGGSAYFDGTGDYLYAGSNTAFQMGTGDFTYECWVYHTSVSGQQTYFSDTFGNTAGMYFYKDASNFIGVYYSSQIATSSVAITAGQWYHLATTRASGTLRIFVNGVQTASVANSTNLTEQTQYIGGDNGASGFMNGYISNARIVKGTAIYTSDFTPPTAPLTAITNTSLLLNFTNAGIIDSTAKNVLETVGNAQIDTAVRKFGDGSIEFDGTGDWLTVPQTPVFALDTGDFTIEFWFYANNTSQNAGLFQLSTSSTYFTSSAGNQLSFQIYQGYFNFSNNAGFNQGLNNATCLYQANQWYHVAFCRQGGVLRYFIDGQQKLSNVSDTHSYTGTYLIVGAFYGTPYVLNGYIDEFRITRGVARYVTNFNEPYVPQGPLPLTGGTYADSTVLLLPGTGVNGAQNNTFLDSSPNNFTVTRNGNATQGTFTPFSRNSSTLQPQQWSAYFDGSGDYLGLSTQAILNVGTGNFTVELWIYSLPVATTYSRAHVFSASEATLSSGLTISLNGANQGSGGISVYMVNATVINYTTAITPNTWTHIALVREGTGANQVKLFVNGVNVASGTSSVSLGSPTYNIGSLQAIDPTFNDFFTGYISNFRTVKSAVYTSNFTPPAAPLTAIPNTSLLTCQSSGFVDNSSNSFVITPAGNTTTSEFNPFPQGTGLWSVSFDGNGDYLTAPSNVAFNLSSGDWTIECWAYFNSFTTTTAPHIFSIGTNSNNRYTLYREPTGGRLDFTAVNSGVFVSAVGTTVVLTGVWYHLAVVSNAGTRTLYVNGTSESTNVAAINSGTNVAFGFQQFGVSAADYLNGYISNLRVVKGTAIYTTNFTPPTAPLTPITNTVLLACQSNRVVDNSANNFTITPQGNSTPSEFIPFAVTNTGSWANYFDGTGDSLGVSANVSPRGTENFTIEFWYYPASLASGDRYFLASSGTDALIFGIANFGVDICVLRDINGIVVANFGSRTQFTENRWNYVAVTRSGNNFRCYINGNPTTTPLVTNSHSFAAPSSTSLCSSVFGYISGLRVSRGIARYTGSTMTVPALPLTVDANTTLLTCQSNRFQDLSANNFAITRNGDVRVVTFSPYEWTQAYSAALMGGSGYFDGTTDFLTTPSNAALDFGTGSFTVECWAYIQSTTGPRAIVGSRTNDTSSGIRWCIYWSGTELASDVWSTGNTRMSLIQHQTPLQLNSWIHCALVRNGNDFRLYYNGVAATTVGNSSLAVANNVTAVRVANFDASTILNLQGYVSGVRIIKGTALYTSNFSPPTSPPTALPNTSLLLNFTNGGITDASMSNVVETVGNAQVSTVQSKWGGGSMSFDGTGDYVVQPTSDSYGYGTGDFTIEFWLYINAISINRTIISNLTSSSSTNPHLYLRASDNRIIYYTANADRIAGPVVTTGVWYHVVLCRAASSTRLFVDGIQEGSTYADSNNYGATAPLGIGTYWASGSPVTTDTLNGYISNLRILKGQAILPGPGQTSQWQDQGFAGSSGPARIPPVTFTVEYLVIAGGGAGGGGNYHSGGGGAGGYRTGNVSVTTETAYTVTVGAGGTNSSSGDRGGNGNDSVFATVTSAGGGGGGNYLVANGAGLAGGSGGGAGLPSGGGGVGGAGNTPSTSPSQGNNGGNSASAYTSPYYAAGGGGAGAVGASGTSGSTNGGNGTASSITGSSVTRAGGGGGSIFSSGFGTGGTGGGGNAGTTSPGTAGSPGTDNTGGGGGAGGSHSGLLGGSGGSGVVILRYPNTRTISLAAGITASTTTSGSDRITTITLGTGTVTWS